MKTKYQTLMDLTQQKLVVMVHLDPRAPEVEVPPDLREGFELRLNFNHNQGARDLQISRWGIRETLRFHGEWVPVSIPWTSVKAFSVSSGTVAEEFVHFAPDEPVSTKDLDKRRLEQLQERLARGVPDKLKLKN